ncbi:putative dNA replication protein dnaC, partial [Escherichia coli 95.0183]
RLIV